MCEPSDTEDAKSDAGCCSLLGLPPLSDDRATDILIATPGAVPPAVDFRALTDRRRSWSSSDRFALSLSDELDDSFGGLLGSAASHSLRSSAYDASFLAVCLVRARLGGTRKGFANELELDEFDEDCD